MNTINSPAILHSVPATVVVLTLIVLVLNPARASAGEPVLANLAPLVVPEGTAGLIASTNLLVTDPGHGAADLTFTVEAASINGQLFLIAAPLDLGDTFTQAQINANLVSYQHDGSETTSDAFTFSVSDGAGGTLPSTVFDINVAPINDDPVLEPGGEFVVSEGVSAMITSVVLLVTDPEQGATELLFTVEATPINGQLFLEATSLGISDTFTQADINAGRLSYAHDGSGTSSDEFEFSVSDGVGGSLGVALFNITILPPPAVPTLQTIGLGVLVVSILLASLWMQSRLALRGHLYVGNTFWTRTALL